MMTKAEVRPALRLPGQNTSNPLLSLLNGVTPKQVAEIDDEIAVTRTYLEKLEKLRDILDDAPRTVDVVAIPALPEPKPAPEPEPEPEPEEEDTPARSGVQHDDDDDDDGEAPKVSPQPAKTRDNPQFKALDEKRRTVADYLYKKGYAPQRHIMRDCKGLGGRNVATVLHHSWFERFLVGGEEAYRLTPAGKREGVSP